MQRHQHLQNESEHNIFINKIQSDLHESCQMYDSYLVKCANVRLVLCVCAEQEGSQERLWVRCQLGQDACHKQVYSNRVFEKVLQPRQEHTDEWTWLVYVKRKCIVSGVK